MKSRWNFPLLKACLICLVTLLLAGCGNFSGGNERISQENETHFDSQNNSAAHLKENMDSEERPSQIQEEFLTFCDRVFKDEMSAATTLDLHYTLLHPESFQIESKEVTLGSFNLADMISNSGDIRDLLSELKAFDRAGLSKDQQLLYDTLLENLSVSLLASGLELYEQPLAPTIGIQAQLPILLSEYAFYSMEDVESYLELLSQIDRYYGELLDFERQKADAGLAPSDTSIDRIIASCESYLIDPEDNFLTETFSERLSSLPEKVRPDAAATEELSARHVSLIREHFIPAYEALISGMETLKGRGIQDGGLAGMKNGRQYYEYLLKSQTGTSYTVPQLKTALVSRMENDIAAIGRLYETYPNLKTDLAAASFSLSDPAEILTDLRRQMAADFPAPPNCSYEICYVPKYLEESLSPAFYLTAPVDDISRNVIYINNGYSDSTENLYTTLAHEGFPGHLYQTVYARANAFHPLMALLGSSGANEGWATYVENYACTLDNGLPPGVGEYKAALRSFSLCVHGLLDIGVNYDGWELSRAKEFITACFDTDDDTIAELFQTMIDSPANYLEYINGFVEISEMRSQAESDLGERFSPIEFHRFLLDMGPVPYSVQRKYFSQWLSGYRSR